MKHPSFRSTALLTFGLVIAGCTSAPTQPAAKSAAAKPGAAPAAIDAHAPTTKPTAAVETPVAPAPDTPVVAVPETPINVAPEALALVERLTQAPDTQRHALTASTSFPEALLSLETGARAPQIEVVDLANQPPPEGLTADGSSTQLIVRDWTGLVLVPISTALSKAYTSEVRLHKIEAHPLNDGRIRIWTRIENVGNRTLPSQVACRFSMRNQPTATSPYFYALQVPPQSFRDVFFISPDGDLLSYTVLVRSVEMKAHP